MVKLASSSKLEQQHVVVVTARRGAEPPIVRRLESGQTLTIGTNPSCGLPLTGDGISPIHCVLRFSEGGLSVQDWYSSSGTLVNGQEISDETPVPSDGRITVGPYSISISVADGEQGDFMDVAPSPEAGADNGPTSQEEVRRDQQPPAELQPSKEPATNVRPAPAVRPARVGSPGLHDSMDREMVELLRAEAQQLQCELAEREQEIEQLRALIEQEGVDEFGGSADVADTTALVDRMEELLDELDRSDERIAALEDLLRCAEDATEAEREEREHIERWLGDIEQRVGQREAEWNAEREALERRVHESTAQIQALEDELHGQLAMGNSDAATERELQRLQAESRQWQEKYQQLEDEHQRCLAELRDLREQGTEEAIQSRIDQAMREQQVLLAQEKARLARKEAELKNLREELEHVARNRERPGVEIDDRVRIFREHLREIHDQEKQNRGDNSLGTRISRLWRRLEGRS